MGSLHSAIIPPVVQAVSGFSCSLGVLSMLSGSGALILVEIVPLFFLCSSEVSAFAAFLCKIPGLGFDLAGAEVASSPEINPEPFYLFQSINSQNQ